MAIKNILKTVFSSKAKTADDGRDQWPSRTSFILAAMGGCVGLGNILRYVRENPTVKLVIGNIALLTAPLPLAFPSIQQLWPSMVHPVLHRVLLPRNPGPYA